MKILITNIVTLNAGDAAILYAMVDVLRTAFGYETEFVVYDKHGDMPARYYPDLEFRKLLYLARENHGRSFKLGLWSTKHGIPLLPQALLNSTERRDVAEYKNADLIVSSGGTYLVENYSLAARIFDYQLSLYLGKPLVFFTQSLGPFADPQNRQALLPIFQESIAVLVRDEHSRANLEELGVDKTKVHLAADAVFALCDVPAIESAKTRETSAEQLKVAISVREWKHFKTIDAAEGMKHYIEALRSLTTYLVEKHNANVTYISTCQGMPEYWTDDSKLAQIIVDGLPETIRQSVSVDSNFRRPAELAATLKNYDLVIATRMHMAIIALSVGTPVLPIAYEFKMHGLFERLGQARWVQDIESVNGEVLIEKLEQFLEALPGMRRPLFTAVQREHASAVASGQIVKQAYEEWRKANHK
ncbi:MAG TPA: polysaccharide pyruvyl transferase family protein [Pyrinomonadaceae bacterium]|nr:polysaccharide pyruvyl transferase family protein [Pyrinomonadaceae bacterium]